MRGLGAGVLLFLAGCGTVKPVDTASVPAPWPKPGPTAVERHTPTAPPPAEEGKPPVPPQKNDVIPKSPTPPSSR